MKPLRDYKGRFAYLACVNGHDLCYQGTSEDCPYCERRVKKKLDTPPKS